MALGQVGAATTEVGGIRGSKCMGLCDVMRWGEGSHRREREDIGLGMAREERLVGQLAMVASRADRWGSVRCGNGRAVATG
ncbi:hypothetical protein E2562_004105 [Oryza meyeriana var. granulata]|uniref:Uncharacterized protein n=1 Tax=Oryza meyeriana var. granulata TaxID=110450 RepID=A0A6G1EUY2_9ORYZ|nr:hypothetical protein E2562_004105 [Oryza meyeriana var. granulata]